MSISCFLSVATTFFKEEVSTQSSLSTTLKYFPEAMPNPAFTPLP